jgi:hypothetical protein
MFSLAKLNNLLIKSKIKHSLRTLTTFSSSPNGFNGSLYAPSHTLDKFQPLINPTLNYNCPSMKSFQLPLTDIKITDILKRQIMNLPEINKNKLVDDPLLSRRKDLLAIRSQEKKKSFFTLIYLQTFKLSASVRRLYEKARPCLATRRR